MTAGTPTVGILRQCAAVLSGVVIPGMAGSTGTAVLRPGIGNAFIVLPVAPGACQICVVIARIIGVGRMTIVYRRPAIGGMTGVAILCRHKVIARLAGRIITVMT